MREHFYRERGQYDMMCAAREGPMGTQAQSVGGPVLCLTRPCQAASFLSTDLPRLISSSRDPGGAARLPAEQTEAPTAR